MIVYFEVYDNNGYDGNCVEIRVHHVVDADGGESLVVPGHFVDKKLCELLRPGDKAFVAEGGSLQVFNDNPVVYGFPSKTVRIAGKTYDCGAIVELKHYEGQPESEWQFLQVEVQPGQQPEENPPEDEEGGDEEGDYKLILHYRGVPLSDVLHTAKDCCNSGDYPADSYEIEEIN